MSTITPAILDAIERLATNLAQGAIEALAQALSSAGADWPSRRQSVLQAFASPHYRSEVEHWLRIWREQAAHISNEAMALALVASAQVQRNAKQAQSVEVVWTGPVGEIPVRRTAQVLHGLIESAQRELLIVSFAVYDVSEIAEALVRAAQRGVTITLVIESPSASAGKITMDGLTMLGSAVAEVVQVYCWPLNQRQVDDQGKHGSLHAKCAVADRTTLLISSANLTRYALNLNMELGVLIRGNPLPANVANHFQQLIDKETLVLFPPSV